MIKTDEEMQRKSVLFQKEQVKASFVFPLHRISLKLLSKRKFPTVFTKGPKGQERSRNLLSSWGHGHSTAVSTTMTWQTTEPSVVDAPQCSHDPLAMQESDLSTPIIG